jgi:polyprenyl P-hydroxybenzoate/phenylacrylic acid decarboxylase-like protein
MMPQNKRRPRLVVGISGASGVAYGARLLTLLKDLPVETHLVVSRAAEMTLALETELKPAELRSRADVAYAIGDMAAPIASGSFRTLGMIVAPCSIRSMSEIATGVTTTLLTRAADVVLKERRRLVLAVRETPKPRRDDRPHPRPPARPVRPRHRHRAPLGRAARGLSRQLGAGQRLPQQQRRRGPEIGAED